MRWQQIEWEMKRVHQWGDLLACWRGEEMGEWWAQEMGEMKVDLLVHLKDVAKEEKWGEQRGSLKGEEKERSRGS
jgi:hypothetical protein